MNLSISLLAKIDASVGYDVLSAFQARGNQHPAVVKALDFYGNLPESEAGLPDIDEFRTVTLEDGRRRDRQRIVKHFGEAG